MHFRRNHEARKKRSSTWRCDSEFHINPIETTSDSETEGIPSEIRLRSWQKQSTQDFEKNRSHIGRRKNGVGR